MKIRSVETYVLDLPTLRPLRTSVATLESLETVIVRLQGEDGVCGLGEACTIGPATWGSESAESIRVAVERSLAPLLVGEDVSRMGALIERLTRAIKDLCPRGEHIPWISE